jgi:hypothetical protein
MTFFWILWAIDAIIALVVLYFFFVGLADGSVSSFNMGIWVIMMLAVAGILFGGFMLMKYQYLFAAKLVLSILAVPGFLYGLMLLSMMGIKDWK